MESFADSVAIGMCKGRFRTILEEYCRHWRQNPTHYVIDNAAVHLIKASDTANLYELLSDDQFRLRKKELFGINALRSDLQKGRFYFSGENPDLLRWSQTRRGLDPGVVDKAIRLDTKWRKARTQLGKLQRKRNQISQQIAKAKNKEEREKAIKNLISSTRKIGINSESILHKDFNNLNDRFSNSSLIDISMGLIKTRLIKDNLEIEILRKSCNIVDKVMKKIPDILHEGIQEYEIAAEIDYLMQKNGAEKPAFETISSFGKNTAEPHYSHGENKLKNGNYALFDFGACYRKYNSDITRTFICGNASKKDIEIH